MDTAVRTHKDKTIIEATATAEETDRAIDAGMRDFMRISGMQIPIDTDPALRQRMIESIGNDPLGEAVRESVLESLVPFALTEAGIVPGMKPEVNAEGNPRPGEPFAFTVTVLPKPQLELNSYEPVEIEVVRDEDESDEEFEQHKISAVVGVWASRLDRDVPQEMWRAFTDASIQRFVAQLAAQGKTVDAFCAEQDTTREKMYFIMDNNAHAALLSSIAMDALVRHYRIKPDKEDERRAAKMLVPEAPTSAVAIDRLNATGRGYLLQENASRLAATNWAMAHATVAER